jgi:sarcosine oxidase
VVARLLAQAAAAGVDIRGGVAMTGLLERGGRIAGLAAGSQAIAGDAVVVCAGAWTARLVPGLAGALRAVGQPVFHLRPAAPDDYRAERFPVFGADIARTGYYGFPIRDGVVKIANHGVGLAVDPAGERAVTAAQEAALRAFLADSFPGLAAAPIAYRRLCVYCDTADEHFWIAADPEHPGLVVATGGSGHAFKFAPVLGQLIADATCATPGPMAGKFAWRSGRALRPEEAARHHPDRGRSEE